MPKSGVYGEDTKKAKPYSEKGDTSKDSPVGSSDKGDRKLGRDRSRSPQPPKMSVFTEDLSKQSWLSFISKYERIATRRKWTAQKKLDHLYNYLSETALEYANRCEGQNDYTQLRAELAPRFDLGIPWWLLGRNSIPFVKSWMRGWRYFCRGICPSVWMGFHRRTQSFCNM